MPDGWTYGMGYWMPKPVTMAKLRARIDRDPDTMEKLMRRLRRQQEFALETEDYKSPAPRLPPRSWSPGIRPGASPSATTASWRTSCSAGTSWTG